MVLIIDNYDSFTYNLVQYLGELGVEITVVRNDAITIDEIWEMQPEKIVLSPGPCTPREAGISVPVVQAFHTSIPILGVCLGHQAIGEAFGGKVVHAPAIFHGKISAIQHAGRDLFKGVPSPFHAARYHSLVVDPTSIPDLLEITATTPDGVVMGLKHRRYPTYGVQFHPESIATEHGKLILKNFLNIHSH